MTKRSPIIAALLWGIGVALIMAASARWIGESEPNWLWVGVGALIAFAMPYLVRPGPTPGSPGMLRSPFPESVEASALLHAAVVGAFMLVWGLGINEGVAQSLRFAGVMTLMWYLANREERYLTKGVKDYPARWITVDRLFIFLVAGTLLVVILAGLVAPDRIDRDELNLALIFAVPFIGAAFVFRWLRKKQLAKLSEARTAATAVDV